MFRVTAASALGHLPTIRTAPFKRMLQRLGLSGIVIALLSGCAALDRSLVTMAVSHNDTLDQIDRNTALLNILRAADEQPLSFTTISYLGGNGSISAGGSLSESRRNFLSGVTSLNESLFFNLNQGFNYSLGTLDNEQFMRAFLAALPLDKLHFLSEGTYLENDILWTLVADSVTTQSTDGRRVTTPNKTSPREWATFQSIVAASTRLGLSLEERMEMVPVGPRLSRDEAMMQLSSVINSWNGPSYGPPAPGMAKPTLVETGSSNPSQSHQLMMVSMKPRFCFSPPRLNDWGDADRDLLCSRSSARAELERRQANGVANATTSAQPIRWQSMDVRSPREVFYFLGRVVREQRDGATLLRVGDSSRTGSQSGKPLFRVICDKAPDHSDPLAIANYRGMTCHVPRDQDSHSAQVLQYLSLLVTLSKVPGSVPSSPAVLVR